MYNGYKKLLLLNNKGDTHEVYIQLILIRSTLNRGEIRDHTLQCFPSRF